MQQINLKLLFLILLVDISSCSTLNPNVTDVLHKFCAFHQSEIGQVLLTPEQLAAGRIVCGAVGDRLGTE